MARGLAVAILVRSRRTATVRQSTASSPQPNSELSNMATASPLAMRILPGGYRTKGSVTLACQQENIPTAVNQGRDLCYLAEVPETTETYGCTECGYLTESPRADYSCENCRVGLVVAVGGEASAAKAQALIAWARRDATEVIEGRGTLLGFVCGITVGAFISLLGNLASNTALAVPLWGAGIGAGAGTLLALRVHRKLTPQTRLQPVVIPAKRQQLKWLLLLWVVVPLILGSLARVYGDGDINEGIRKVVGRLWLGINP